VSPQKAELAGRIKSARSAKGWKQKNLAAEVRVEPITVSHWERGATTPDFDGLALIAEATGKPLGCFLGDEPTTHTRASADGRGRAARGGGRAHRDRKRADRRCTRRAARRAVMRFLTLVAVLLAGSLVAPAWAGAATVSISEGFDIDGEKATLLYDAGPGESNDVVINGTDHLGLSSWLVTEEGEGVVLTPGPGCAGVSAQLVRCTLTVTEASIKVVVLLSDLEDAVSAAGACGYLLDETGNTCGAVRIRGGSDKDVLIGPDADTENRHLTVIRGGEEDDYLVAEEPGSELVGGPGDDWLEGAGGRDTLQGGGGEDTIVGGSGRDLLFGGRQNDTFYARDRLRDQVRGGSGRDRARIDVGRDVTRSIERLF
jgi:transcriptional regulator with XRE-family HTH domain